MLIAKWTEWVGANKQVTPRRLAGGLGVDALNLRTSYGDLRGWNGAYQVVGSSGGATPLVSAYRMNRSVVSDTDAWLQWTSDVDVVPSLIANDASEEIYYTGDGVPKRTDSTLALPASPSPTAWRSLGIPKPSAAMTVALNTAGTGANETRTYVDTFVNNQGRESAPGTATQFVCKGGSSCNLTNLAALTGSYPDVTLRRIYVSVDGSEYQRCVEQGVALTTAVDSGTRGPVLQSGGDLSKPAWEMPPSNLSGLIPLWNGMVGGFFGKSWAICQAWKPWAWPVEYQQAIFDTIVGTGKWTQNWVLLTTGSPVILTGTSPGGMSEQPVPRPWACVSKRSIVGLGHGVAWATRTGLAYVGESGATMLTEGILSPEQWQALAPETIIGSVFNGNYVGFYNDGSGLKGFILDPINPKGSIGFLSQGARGVYYDRLSDRLYLQDVGNVIRRFNDSRAGLLQVSFTTGVVRVDYETNAGIGLVVADEPVSVDVTLWANLRQADNSLVWTQVHRQTVTSGVPFALPGGYLAQEFQARVITTGPVQALLIAEDESDLQ